MEKAMTKKKNFVFLVSVEEVQGEQMFSCWAETPEQVVKAWNNNSTDIEFDFEDEEIEVTSLGKICVKDVKEAPKEKEESDGGR